MMRPQINNEQGYTLLLAVLIGVLFSILTVTLITFTMSGISKNDVREDNQQATAFSQKGLSHITNYIYTNLNETIGDEGMPQSAFIDYLDDFLNRLVCSGYGTNLSNRDIESKELNEIQYDACISEISDKDENGEELPPTQKKVTFRSTAIVDGIHKEMESTMIIGAQAVPDALNYAIGSHCVGDCDDIDGEGNLFLHGGVHIEGDLKVDGNIITSNQGIMRTSSRDWWGNINWQDHWISSIRPVIIPGPESNNEKARVVLGKDVFTFNSDINYANHIERKNFNGYTNATNKLSQAFSIAPEIVQREPLREYIDVNEMVHNGDEWINKPEVRRINQSNYSNVNHSNDMVFAYIGREESSNRCIEWRTETNRRWVWSWNPFPGYWEYYDVEVCDKYEENIIENAGEITLEGNSTFKRFGTSNNRNVKITDINRRNSRINTSINIDEIMYVGGDLTVGNETDSYDPADYDIIELAGREIYVNGNLTIKGANLESDVIIYVNGNVTIKNTVINGKNLGNGKTGSLIIFADKSIDISNNSVNQNTPSRIHGYFYSNDVFEMYGVGSNVEVTGGISARRIVMNAVRGTVNYPGQYGCGTGFKNVQGSCYQTNQNINTEPRRLSVIYNPGIVGRFSELTFSESIIRKVDPPQIINRK